MKTATEQQVTFARGLNSTAAPTEYRPDEVETLYNGRVSFNGNAIERRDGSIRLHTTALNSGGTGYGGLQFTTTAGVIQLCVFAGDKFYFSIDDGMTWTNPSGATSLDTSYWSMVQMRVGATNYLISANGDGSIYKWDGTTWGTWDNVPSGGVKYLAVFNGRLYAAGHSGNTVAASKVWDPDTWAAPDGFQIEVDTHDGDNEVRGLFQIGSILLAFKSDSTNYLEGFGYETINVQAGSRGISRSVGCMAFRSIAQAGDIGVAWMSERGFEYFNPAAGEIQLISRPIQQFIEDASWTTIRDQEGFPTAMYWSSRNEYLCAFPSISTQNDYIFRWRPPTYEAPSCIMLDLSADSVTELMTVYTDSEGYLVLQEDTTKSLVRLVDGYMRIATPGVPALYVTKDSSGYLKLAQIEAMPATLFAADSDADEQVSMPFSIAYDGRVRKLESGDKDDALTDGSAGEDILMKVRSRPFVFRNQTNKKNMRRALILSQQDDNAAITMRAVVDSVTGTDHAKTLSANSSAKPVRARVTGKGYALQVEVETSDKIQIQGLEVSADYLRDPL